jgi:hypothetical protein
MTESYGDAELMSLTSAAKELDEQLAQLQPTANASHIGSSERLRYAELRSKSETAWQQVMNRVLTLKSLTNDLRDPLPEDD